MLVLFPLTSSTSLSSLVNRNTRNREPATAGNIGTREERGAQPVHLATMHAQMVVLVLVAGSVSAGDVTACMYLGNQEYTQLEVPER